MKYSMIIRAAAGAGILFGSLNVMASGFGGGWSHDSNTGTLMNANARSYSDSVSATAMKSEKVGGFGDGWSKNSHTNTLMNANAPSYEKQTHAAGDKTVTLNSFGGGAYQDNTTRTLTRID
jgi:hypothetical protein